MYKKYKLLAQRFSQSIPVEGIVKVEVLYKSVDPEKIEDESDITVHNDFRNEIFYLDFNEGDEITWATIEDKVQSLGGIVSTYNS